MGIKEAIAEFKRAASEPERFDVYMLSQCVGSATDWCMTDDECEILYYNFHPRAPNGIFPIGNIAVDYTFGLVYLFEEDREGEVTICYDNAVSLIEAISKEL